MKVAMVIAPREFRDETVSKARQMFRKWGIDPILVGLVPRECIGSHGAVYSPDLNLSKVSADDFDAIMLIDGKGVDTYKIYDLMPLLDLLRDFAVRGKIIIGVNNGVKIIARANIIAGKKVAVAKDIETERLVRLYKGVVSDKEIEHEANIMSISDSTKTEEIVAAVLDRLGVR